MSLSQLLDPLTNLLTALRCHLSASRHAAQVKTDDDAAAVAADDDADDNNELVKN